MTYPVGMDSPADWTRQLVNRRGALGLLGAAGAAVLAACGAKNSNGSGSTDSTSAPVDTTAVDTTPAETGGPFPSDGTNTNGSGGKADILHDARAFRRDIRSDLDGRNKQDGTDLDLQVTVVDTAGKAREGVAVYVWHCNADGAYSGYSAAMSNVDHGKNSFLRGVQVTDKDGNAKFTTIVPGRYSGRAFHIHFEVWDSKKLGSLMLTSQMASNDDAIEQIYTEIGYGKALAAVTHNAQDNVFSDGMDRQMITWAKVDGKYAAYFNAVT